jgi:hypothetical protein
MTKPQFAVREKRHHLSHQRATKTMVGFPNENRFDKPLKDVALHSIFYDAVNVPMCT